MHPVHYLKNLRLLPILALPFLAWMLPPVPEGPEHFSPEKVNLALRRTADGLLRLSGDSTSRIPAVEQEVGGVWRLRLDEPFDYAQLPALLQASLDMYGIRQTYEVSVRRCFDGIIDIGYHQMDVLQGQDIPCGSRDMPEGCHFIEVAFLGMGQKNWFWPVTSAILLLVSGALAGFWLSKREKLQPDQAPDLVQPDWLEFGQSRLDVAGQILLCNGVRETLTFRETKLLRLFAANPHQLLERDFILREVWADEGVLVGRSVDVFVSRLRKKLAADASLGIVAVHGVGYRLETGKSV